DGRGRHPEAVRRARRGAGDAPGAVRGGPHRRGDRRAGPPPAGRGGGGGRGARGRGGGGGGRAPRAGGGGGGGGGGSPAGRGRGAERRPGDLSYIRPEPHDSGVVGDEPYVSLHFLGADRYAT